MSKHFEDYDTGEASRRRLTDAEKAEIAEIVRTKWEEQAPGAFIRATVGKETNASGMVRVRIAVMPRA